MRNEDANKIDDAVEHAEACFWMAVMEIYPNIKTGDVNPLVDAEFQAAMKKAITAWLELNAPKPPPATASCEIVVEMRPPREGEFGYHAHTTDPQGVLKEITAAFADGEVWVADEDWSSSKRAEEHKRFGLAGPVTVLFRPKAVWEFPECQMHATPPDMLMKLQGFTPKPDLKPPAPLPPIGEMTKEGKDWAAFVSSLPEHHGWTAHWEFPGFVAWYNKRFPGITFVATPDWDSGGKAEIVVDVQNAQGNRIKLGGMSWDACIPWPKDMRTPESYMVLVGIILDNVTKAATSIRCPHCGCEDLDQLSVTETFTGYHNIRGKHNAEGPTMLENALAGGADRFDDGKSDYRTLCNACGKTSKPEEAGLGDPDSWDWV